MLEDVPPDTPVTTPEPDPIVATVVRLLVHVPPGEVLLNVVVDPTHTEVVPVIGAGASTTVTVVVASVPQPFE